MPRRRRDRRGRRDKRETREVGGRERMAVERERRRVDS